MYVYICLHVHITVISILKFSLGFGGFARFARVSGLQHDFQALLLFGIAQAWPRRTFGYFYLRRRGPDVFSADKLLFWTAQAWPRGAFGYLGLRRRGSDALSADNSFSGSRYYAGENSVFVVFYFSVFLWFFAEAIWAAQA